MKGVILAAGFGKRMALLSPEEPKALVKLCGRSIIDYTLDAFLETGVDDVAIVTGYQGDTIRERVGARHRGLLIHYLSNPDFDLGNAISVYVARSFTGDAPFLLSMADHVVSAELLLRLLQAGDEGNSVAVDFNPSPEQIVDATRVLVSREGRVEAIGKELSEWNGIDAGVFRFTRRIFEAIEEVIRQQEAYYELSAAVGRLIEAGHPLWARDVSGCFWHDVDTPKDLEIVTQRLRGDKGC